MKKRERESERERKNNKKGGGGIKEKILYIALEKLKSKYTFAF